MLKTRVPAVLFVLFAVIWTSISIAQDTQTGKSPNDLIGSWIVKVEGADKNRSMVVTNISKSPEGSFVLEAKFGWPGSENPVVSAEVQQTEKGFTLSLASKSGAKVFAEQARDGSFVGNFVNASGSAVPARITKTAENSASLKPIAIEAPITAMVEPPSPISSIQAKRAGIPKECAVFGGRWSGVWQRGGVGRINISVTSIDKDCNASINYGGFLRAQTRIVDGTLQEFICNESTGGYCTFKISNDGTTLDASYWNPSGGKNYATFSRLE